MFLMPSKRSGAIALALVISQMPAWAAPLQYQATLIASPSFENSEGSFNPIAVNDPGQATGAFNFSTVVRTFLPDTVTPEGTIRNFTFQDQEAAILNHGVLTRLGTMGLLNSSASGINAQGQVSGTASSSVRHSTSTLMQGGQLWTTLSDSRAFLYSDGTLTDLGTLGGSFSESTAINASGQVLGNSTTTADNDDAKRQAFIYSKGQLTGLGTLGGSLSRANAFNDSGLVTGSSLNAQDKLQAFIYQDGLMTGLDVGGEFSTGTAISSDGRIAGQLTLSDGSQQVFLYQSGQVTLLNLPMITGGKSFASAKSVNDRGDVVGHALTGDYRDMVYLYTDGQAQDINSLLDPASQLNVTVSDVLSIDDEGRIMALAGSQRYLLTPTGSIPEPQSALLMSLGLLAMTLASKRR